MKGRFWVRLQELLMAKSKKPWACFETAGFDPDKGLGLAMHWNDSFIAHLHASGIQGINDQETLQLFFLYMSSRISESIDELGQETETVNPSATPNLTTEANQFRRG
jgi:hypothetical protein